MAVFKCKMCGGDLEIQDGQTVVTCPYCGSTQTISVADDEKKINLFNRANNLRLKCEFDKALSAYQSIISEFTDDAEAYWGLCLCKYGIEYVDDPRTGDKVPTCHRTLFESILDDSDYLEALNLSDVIARDVYISEAKEIDRLQKHIIKISQKEDPYDIFICYKETDDKGQRTEDSVLAHDIYEKLTEKGYKVFFSRISLENKLGQEYEPIIFAALRSAKIMICVGTNEDYFNAVWVKNEWSRFLSFMKDDKDKYLIPCYKGISPYDMPEEFTSLQSQDMGKLGYIQDLVRGIDKIFGKDNKKNIVKTDDISSYATRIENAISEGSFDKAEWILEELFSVNSSSGIGYFYRLLINKRYHSIEELIASGEEIDNELDFLLAIENADQELKDKLISYANQIKLCNVKQLYDDAINLKNNGQFDEAISIFNSISFYEDSKKQIKECSEKINLNIYNKALEEAKKQNFDESISLFTTIIEYKDSKTKIEELRSEKTLSLATNSIKRAISLKNKVRFDEGITQLETIKKYKNVPDLILQFKKEWNNHFEHIQKTKKKKKIIIGSVLSGVALLTTFIIVLCTVIVPSSKYNNAISLVNEGKYDVAQRIFYDLNYKDSKNQSELIKARKYLDNNNYTSAMNIICNIGGKINFSYVCDVGTLSKTHDIITRPTQFELPTWTHNGYHVDNWNVNSFTINNQDPSYLTDIELKPTYTISQYKIELHKLNMAKVDETINYNIEQEVKINDPTRFGYEFTGWSGSELTSLTKNLTLPKGTYGDKSYLANWKAIDYKITYHLDGGTTTNPATYTVESDFALTNAIKDGYSFAGWFKNPEMTKSITHIVNMNGDIDLYAKYTVNSYTYIFDANGGSFENPKKKALVTYVYGQSYDNEVIELASGSTIPFKSKSISYEKLVGWFTDSNFVFPFNFNETIEDDLTLYAKWESISYQLASTAMGSHYYSIPYNTSQWEPVKFEYYYIADKDCTISLSATVTNGKGYSDSVSLGLSNVTKGTSSSGEATTYGTSTSASIVCSEGDTIHVSVSGYPKVGGKTGLYYLSGCSAKTVASTAKISLPERVSTYTTEIVYDTKFDMPIPSYSGHTFKGWKYGNTIITDSTIQKWNIPMSATLIAVWE